MMSNLPGEILDHIVDLLHDSQIPLRNCCLVSKSWIPRTRRHLFAEIRFQTSRNLLSWKKTFRDPSTSPACYTKNLLIGPKVLADEDAYMSGWIGVFSRVVRLELVGQDPFDCGWRVACVVFPGFSPAIKSLRVDFSYSRVSPSSQLFDFILSFPLLEDLSVTNSHHESEDGGGDSGGLLTVVRPPGPHPFTGSLALFLGGGMGPYIRWVLSLPGGIHFRKIALEWFCDEDVSLTMALVKKCSHALETLDITDERVDQISAPFNLSKATKLVCAVFRPKPLRVEWITHALRGITREHRDLRRILVDVSHYWARLPVDGDARVRQAIREGDFEQWLDLDRTLVHLWESFSIRANVRWARGGREGVVADYVGCLLPEMTKRGMVTVNLVE